VVSYSIWKGLKVYMLVNFQDDIKRFFWQLWVSEGIHVSDAGKKILQWSSISPQLIQAFAYLWPFRELHELHCRQQEHRFRPPGCFGFHKLDPWQQCHRLQNICYISKHENYLSHSILYMQFRIRRCSQFPFQDSW
jgi:hypothetical protein